MLSVLSGWVWPILGSALFLGIYDVCKKHAVRANAVMPVLFFTTFFGTCTIVIYAVATGQFLTWWTIPFTHRLLLMAKALIVSASWACLYYALRELPISIAAPLRASGPVWTFIGSLIWFAEIPTWTQGLGMLAIFGGYCLFSIIGCQEGFPWRHPRVLITLLGTIIGGFSALYDKFLMNSLQFDPRVVQFQNSIYMSLLLGIAYVGLRLRLPKAERQVFSWRWTIVATGVILVISDALYFYAVSVPEVKISILSLMRRSSVVISFLIGGGFFHEKQLARKAVAMGFILLGVLILALAG